MQKSSKINVISVRLTKEINIMLAQWVNDTFHYIFFGFSTVLLMLNSQKIKNHSKFTAVTCSFLIPIS